MNVISREMQILGVSGVKGGVGKSTFAVLLAYELSRTGSCVILCDCDVECPNDHLIMNQPLENQEPIFQRVPRVEIKKCKRCGICSEVCRENAIFWVKGKPPTFILDLCNGCGSCAFVCKENAISWEKRVVGWSFSRRTDENFYLITGRSLEGLAETSIVVRETKKRAMKLAKDIKAEYLIIDTAAGAHCNVVNALLGCDLVFVVAEPTPVGAHDLGVMMELLDKLNLPRKVILNKANIGKREIISKILKKFNAEIVMEIPYSEEILKAYCNSELSSLKNLLDLSCLK